MASPAAPSSIVPSFGAKRSSSICSTGYAEIWMQLAEFDYLLPEELIAQEALPDRAASRMLVVYREEQRWEDREFREFPSFLRSGDCLVLNNTRVFPARLYGHRAGVAALPVGKHNP